MFVINNVTFPNGARCYCTLDTLSVTRRWRGAPEDYYGESGSTRSRRPSREPYEGGPRDRWRHGMLMMMNPFKGEVESLITLCHG